MNRLCLHCQIAKIKFVCIDLAWVLDLVKLSVYGFFNPNSFSSCIWVCLFQEQIHLDMP
jgi:hypothetical protein